MFEITYADNKRLQELIAEGKAPKNAKYDFTFENKYIIYHHEVCHELHYIAKEINSGSGSFIFRRELNSPINKEEYPNIINSILFSIKYTGDTRYLGVIRQQPLAVIEAIFRSILPNYRYAVRDEQIVLSKRMYIGLTEKTVSLCEAEVGSGKSLAYLVAGIVAKNCNPSYKHLPITITTSNIELQNALVNKEIPNLSRILQEYGLIREPLTAVLRKGKEHYFCKARFFNYFDTLLAEGKKHEKLINKYYRDRIYTKAFDLDDYDFSPTVKEKICVKGSCGKCKKKSECHYSSFIKKAKQKGFYDFQITNHNLYLNSMRLLADEKTEILLPSELVIIDEAHKFKDAAQDCFGARINRNAIPNYISYIIQEAKVKREENVPRLNLLLQELGKYNRKFFGDLYEIYKEVDSGTLIELPSRLITKIHNLITYLAEIEEIRWRYLRSGKGMGSQLIKSLQHFIRQNNINIWIDVEEDIIELCCSPKDLGEQLFRTVWNRGRKHVLTSGTMSDGVDFEFFKNENGINKIAADFADTSSTESPFDYERNARLYIPEDMPLPDTNDKKYIGAVAEQILKLVKATNGHTAVLFTSYKLLTSVHELIADKLSCFDVICMSRRSKTAIAEFKKSKNAVLFATGSMWEGVDCKGDVLSSVIIPRLPFPQRSATLEQKKDECDSVSDFVQKHAIPEMLIKLRQGAGRLIRTETDTGLITILDSRANSESCGTRVKTALRKYPEVKSIKEISEFFHEVKSNEYYEN